MTSFGALSLSPSGLFTRVASSTSTPRRRDVKCQKVHASAAAGDGAGSIRREVLDRSARGKINTVDDYNFYAFPRFCTHVDDEYAQAGVRDPKVCVTTARDPSSRLKQFSKEVRLIFPNAQRINRGSTKLSELVGMKNFPLSN